MTDYKSDRAWSDQFIPAIKRVVGPLLLTEASVEVDRQQATDLMVFRGRDMTIAARVRRRGYAEKYPYEFTIRASRDNGAVTELAKIVNGFGDWMMYAHEGQEAGQLARWFVIDLSHWRAHMIRNGNSKVIRSGTKHNGDGTHFAWFDLRSFPPHPPILVASSHHVSHADRCAA